LDKKRKIFYPKDRILQYVKRSGKESIDQLFTKRALVILGSIILDINKVEHKETRNLLFLCFTSMLPNVSIMIPGDKEKVCGKSGWVISKLWAPKIHTEKNIFISFQSRFNKIFKGKKEISDKIKYENATIFNINAENIRRIKSGSIDYIFTDPPYGQNIAYFGLSMFWNSWLKNNVDYENEIIYDPYRNKLYDDYGTRMFRVFKELYRVLKNNSYMCFTFHNRDLNIWKIVIDAIKNSGFYLKGVVYQEQAVFSGTQGINWKNTLRGDFVYKLQKNEDYKKETKKTNNSNNEKIIINNVSNWIRLRKDGITSDKLYERLIPFIIKRNAYLSSDGRVINIEELLNKNFKYDKTREKNKSEYTWQI